MKFRVHKAADLFRDLQVLAVICPSYIYMIFLTYRTFELSAPFSVTLLLHRVIIYSALPAGIPILIFDMVLVVLTICAYNVVPFLAKPMFETHVGQTSNHPYGCLFLGI